MSNLFIPNDGSWPVGRCIQTVKFITPKTIRNGETLRMSLARDDKGNIMEGDFLATIDKDNNVRIIGNG